MEKSIGEKWHEQSQTLGAIEGVIMVLALMLGFTAFIFAGACSHATTSETNSTSDTCLVLPVKDIQQAVAETPKLAAKTDISDPVEPPSPEIVEEDIWYDSDYSDYTEYYGGRDYGNPFRSAGVADDGTYSYSWYPQSVLDGSGLTALNNNGRHIDESTGYIVDGDGYIAVAMNGVPDDGSYVVDTMWGPARVYDHIRDNAPYDGHIDVYTDFSL